MTSRLLLVALGVLTACSSSSSATTTDAGNSDAASDASSNSCVRLGGICEPLRPENMACDGLAGRYEQAYGIDCGGEQACCVTRDDAGQWPPPLDAFVDCGALLCPPGLVCQSGTDTVSCVAPSDAGSTTAACSDLGGICQPRLPENMTCDNLAASREEAYGIDCGAQRGCCVQRSDAGPFPPPLDGYVDCSGRLLCPPGFGCTYLTDTVECTAIADAGAGDF